MNISELHKEFNKSKFVSCISKKDLIRMIDSSNSVKLVIDNKLVGLAYSRRLAKKWCDIGPVYLLKAYRGKQIGAKLIKDIHEICMKKKVNIVATTMNPKVKKILINLGYKQTSFKELPLGVKVGLLKKIINVKLICYLKKGAIGGNWERYVYYI